ncbi:ATP-binding cassette domain-containing protein [Oceanirhabdus sp. W0125-5]|uniref:ATP-binding cassette domain-containing protein n=1 Tax=Oceanirhabdus sp. W0125-5 TaxID=2999116 RepID=UPI0022F30A34|nr:ATP-binding cassette domain-containing protein [Oceanirhabdus sp. W0125-5]WBW97752.1 ATP-binding cassette domain-containing protein [Oceanirhabdus sp. W0125-5]
MSIVVKNLSKKYKNSSKKSVDNVSINIPTGIFGLLGENGAGKTTFLKMLTTLLPSDSGEIKILNYNMCDHKQEIRNIIGYTPQEFDFFSNITTFELMDYIAILKNIKNESARKEQIYDLLNKFNLGDKVNTKIKHLSGGMKQRLGIAQSLLGNPKVIILDEPTVGLDPNERLRFRNIINELSQTKTVIISTHIISDVAMMCESVAIMKNGKVIYSGDINTLLDNTRGKVFIDTINNACSVDDSKYGQVISVLRKNDIIEIRFISKDKPKINTCIEIDPTLEDAYFYMMFCSEGE